MKFNLANCMKKKCLLNGKLYVEFAVGCKLKHEIGPNKPTASSDIDIQQVSTKHFFWMAQKKDYKGYLWIPRVSINNCKKECCAGVASSTRKWCASTMNSIIPDDFDKFMKGKSEYAQEELLKKVSKEYHSVINVFIKCKADVLPKHQEEDHTIQLEEDKNPLFVQNYRLFSDQKNNNDKIHPRASWERLHLT